MDAVLGIRHHERVTAPRFDNPVLAGLNVLSILAFAVIVSLFVWSWRRGRKPQWRDLLLLVHFSVASWYVPVFPLIWLGMEREDNRLPSGAIRFPFE